MPRHCWSPVLSSVMLCAGTPATCLGRLNFIPVERRWLAHLGKSSQKMYAGFGVRARSAARPENVRMLQKSSGNLKWGKPYIWGCHLGQLCSDHTFFRAIFEQIFGNNSYSTSIDHPTFLKWTMGRGICVTISCKGAANDSPVLKSHENPRPSQGSAHMCMMYVQCTEHMRGRV